MFATRFGRRLRARFVIGWILVPGLLGSLVHASDIPGRVECSWVGNTFEGAGVNGEGRWVQHCVDEIEVTPDGSVITAHNWDEAGRCTGIYKDGDVNRVLLRQNDGRGGHQAWGWGTSSSAVAVEGARIYIANADGLLLVFEWDPNDIHRNRHVAEANVCKAIAAVAGGGELFLLDAEGAVQVIGCDDLCLRREFRLAGATDLTLDREGMLWAIIERRIERFDRAGKPTGLRIDDAGKPVALGMDHHRGRLVVCDDGPRQQVLFYEIGTHVKRVDQFGDEGGIGSGTPGEATPTKLFSLVGAGVDAEGNLFVCMGRNETIIRQFDPDRKQVWEVQSHPFVECSDFDPTADGERIYGIEQIIEMDYTRPPGQQWRLKSMTRNLVRFPDDQRAKDASGWSTYLRWIDGKRVMFGIGQMAGGLHVMVFDDPPSDIARYCGFIDAHGGGWAWEVDERGNIWQGESAGKSIRRYPFGGFDEKGNPIYDPSKAERFDWPAPFERVQRVKYIATTDTMYIAGYVPGKGERSWGLVGAVLCRYDNWMKGNRTAAYTVDLPVDGEKLHPKSMDVAGDYVFFAMVKPTNNRPAMVHVLDNRTGGYVGAMWPGETVGGNSGWIDTVTGMRAFRRKNGEYLVLIEEGWRAKNILYRWTPTTSD